jgi:deoxyadenosine/deoxycytidine kinase
VANSRTVIFVAGPTASGKTTLVKRLANQGVAYIEESRRNPYFSVRSGDSFDAESSQHWFLDQIATFVRDHVKGILVIDQHPLVVSRVYGAMFFNKRLLSKSRLGRLDRSANRIVEELSAPRTRSLTVCLSASTNTLAKRLRRRKRNGLSSAEVKMVNELYSTVVFPGPCLPMNTDVVTVEREITAVHCWLDDPGHCGWIGS